MSEGENLKWGKYREDYYADEKESNKKRDENDEEDEYNEILKLQEIRAKKMKLAQNATQNIIQKETQNDPKIISQNPTNIISYEKQVENIEGLTKVSELPKSIGQTPYGQDLLSEYEKIYNKISLLESDKTNEKAYKLQKNTMLQYALNLQKLILAKSQNLEANELIEEVIRSRKKVDILSDIIKPTLKPQPEIPIEKPNLEKNQSIEIKPKHALKRKLIPIEKPAKKVKKALIITSGNSEEIPVETQNDTNSEPLLKKGHSFLSDYLTNTVPVTQEESKRAQKKKQKEQKAALRHIEEQPEKEEEDEFYQKILQEKENAKLNKLKKEEAKIDAMKNKSAQAFSVAQRNINYSILKAKGLTRKRKKIDRNSRVKLRYKYEKAVKARRVFFIFIMSN